MSEIDFSSRSADTWLDSYQRNASGIQTDGAAAESLETVTLDLVEQASALSRVTLELVNDAVIVVDVAGCVQLLNTAAEQLAGWPSADACGKPLSSVYRIVDEITFEDTPNPAEQALMEGTRVESSTPVLLLARDRHRFAIEHAAAPLYDHNGTAIGAVLVFRDVSESRNLARELSWQANHDVLTGLFNRRAFEQYLEEAVVGAGARDRQHILCYLDLDQFKIINDACSHVAGDELLRQVSSTLQERVRRTDILARIGGDEFGLLLYQCNLERAMEVVHSLCQAVQDFRFVWQGKTFNTSISIGVVLLNGKNESVSSALSAADAACHVAKSKGRNRIHVYQPDDLDLAAQRGEMQWVVRIPRALEENRFQLYCQPIVSVTPSARSGGPIYHKHYEILIRLEDENGKLVPPIKFIPAAESYGLMQTIDRWVISTLFAHLSQHDWETEESILLVNTGNFICTINLSGNSLNDDGFIDFVEEQFRLHRVPPQIICFEITETLAIANLTKAAQLIEQIKSLGCSFALDDFGSGMSSFGYLKHLPVDYLKIDGIFIKDILHSRVAREIVEAINRIGHVMGLQTIAEFVENDEILEELRSLGIDYAQGYGISKPYPLPLSPQIMLGDGTSVFEKLAYPLSAVQQGIWSQAQVFPDAGVEPVVFSVLLSTSADASAFNQSIFNRAWQTVLARHAIFRTTFVVRDGKPVQEIGERASVPFEIVDARGYSAADLQATAIEFANRPFELARGTLCRLGLFESDTKRLLLWAGHPIAFDRESAQVIWEELQAVYQTISESGRDTTVLASSLPYADFVTWQTRLLEEGRGQQLAAFWQDYLGGDLPAIDLPTDRPRSPHQSRIGALRTWHIAAETMARVQQLAAESGTSTRAVLLAAFAAQLYRYTRQTDIPIGTVVSGRTQAEFASLIGNLSNTTIVRGDASNAPTFRVLLERFSQTLSDVWQHRDYPLEVLAAQMQPQQEPGRTLLSQVCFSWLGEVQPLSRPDTLLVGTPYSVNGYTCTTAYDWDVRVVQVADRLCVDWVYNAELFDAETIDRSFTHFHNLLEHALDVPDTAIDELKLLDDAERRLLLEEWNATAANYPRDWCIHQWFAERAAQMPEAVAIEFGPTHLTYGELNRRANQLARHLQQLGVGPDVLVGICVERSLEMAIGVMGIFKAGGAYMPLDPAYPKERLAYMLEDSQIPVLVTQAPLVENLPLSSAQVVCLDADWGDIARYEESNPACVTKPEHLAYLIYTSGSTGKPKGVTIEHRSLTNFTQAAIDRYGIGDRDRVLQFASFSFDAAIEEIYPCLASGGTLVIRTEDMLMSVPTFLEKSREYRLTVLDLPTAYWHQLTFELAANPELALPDTLCSVIIGGEEASPERVAMWHEVVGDRVKLFNTYGPTEATVVATAYEVPAPSVCADAMATSGRVSESESEMRWQSIPIGQPLGNVRTYVLDANHNPTPIGVPGELYVGGAGIARGYLNRPDITAERFISDPFSANLHDRLYKTGDLVRYLRDGNLEFLGRMDSQVKIRGFRIELGEVEAAIAAHPDVKDAVVIARADRNRNKGLVAYVVSNLVPDRLPFQSKCSLEVDGRKLTASTEDLSATGASLTGVAPGLMASDRLKLRLLLPGDREERSFDCEIAWVRQDRVGIRFLLAPHERAIVHQSIDRLLETQGFLKALQRTITRNLRNYLKQTLPDYMVPARFVLMNALPVTPNGKVNRRHLPDPDRAAVDTSASFDAPRTLTEEILVRLWSELLGVEVELQDNFFELGGHSLLVTQLIFRIQETFAVELPARALMESPTVASLAAAIDTLRQRGSDAITTQSGTNFEAEAILDAGIQPEYEASPDSIFLTGATGFLGLYLLHDLLEQTSAVVYCLVRATEPDAGIQRLRDKLSEREMWQDHYERRIIAVPGDLSQPQFGLNAQEFDELAQAVDVIYHNGALVNFSYPYSALKSTNVGGTESVLRLAARIKVKPIHHISTLSVFDALGYYDGRTIFEDEPLRYSEGLLSGYAQSKWVAEKLVSSARDRGLPVAIYRPAEVVGHRNSGHWNTDDYICRMIKGCIQLGQWPNLDISWHLTPVDWVSRAIVDLSRQSASLGQSYHIATPHHVHMHQIFNWLRDRGYALECVPFAQWRSNLVAAVKQSDDNALASMLSFFTEIVSTERGFTMQQMHVESVAPSYDCQNAERGLASSDMVCPPIDEALFATFLAYFVESGFLTPASQEREVVRAG
ncbi:MAG: amino acid adenylation domain-containing protein [Cyanobacteria bacterium J06642_2]